ncbi:PREDICTED: cytochrome P450 89A2-like [Camelina sativa]|uniref:Cytochrome P450 89A2-like n=1 Tax=Camelina sativa TaxID=90675 RepID=A0ABM0UNZ4_CAMSA|nr:PREDICTED: cytochrome P450 89A2-like [Camelina sativa]
MATWFLIIFVSLTLCFLVNLFLRRTTTNSLPLPPNPNLFPILGPFQWLRKGLGGLNSYLRSIHHRLGPIISLRIFSVPAVFVSDRSLTHKALVLNGAVFSDRPPALPTGKIITSNQHTIGSGTYGATWRLLRRNLTSEILNPSRVKSYSNARRSVLENLCDRIRNHGEEEKPIVVVDHLRYAMFSLLVLMCFGDKLDEEQIKRVEFVQRRELLTFSRFAILNVFPSFTKLFLRKRWEEFYQIRREHKDVLLPLIRSRRKMIEYSKDYVQSYVDTLFELQLPEEKRKLNEDEIVSLCSEFLNAGTDTTATTLQWIMANLVKNQEIQERLYKEIKGVLGEGEEKEIEEEEMKKMPYLKAVVLEGLRLHPPGHLLLPHRVSEDTELGGYKVPKNGTINFNVAMIGRDPTEWDEPMEFKPERFIGEDEEAVQVDVTGSRGIKMMPFGAGRRICPGIGLAMLHLEYVVVNMVKEFEWKQVEGDEVDLSEKFEFTVVMKYPLKARAVPRVKKTLRPGLMA